MAGTLHITLAASSPLPLEIYAFHELEYEDENYALNQPIFVIEEHEFHEFLQPTAGRLNGWCKGLVEVRNNQVVFLHRTVRDFLRTREMKGFLKTKVSKTFEPNLSIMKAYVVWIKQTGCKDLRPRITWISQNEKNDSFNEKVNKVMRYYKTSADLRAWHQQLYDDLLDHLEDSILKMFDLGQLQVADNGNSRGPKPNLQKVSLSFRALVMDCDLGTYLSNKLSCDPDYLAEFDEAPVSRVLRNSQGKKRGKCSLDQMIRIILIAIQMPPVF